MAKIFILFALLPFIQALKHDVVMVTSKSTCIPTIYTYVPYNPTYSSSHHKGYQLGSHNLPDSGHWECVNVNSNENCGSFVRKSKKKQTKFQPTRPGVYEVYYNASQTETTQVIRAVTSPTKVPVHRLASGVVHLLMEQLYRYLFLTHNFDRFNNYFPNVGGFFRSKMQFTSKMRDQISEYVLAKHATTSQFGEAEPVDYSCSLLQSGLRNSIQVDMEEKLNISAAMRLSFSYDTALVADLTTIVSDAEEFEDKELSEFVASDLIANLSVNMKETQSFIETVDRLTIDNVAIGEYVFDKMSF